MNTFFEIWLCGDDDDHLRAVTDAVEDEVRRIESVLSRFDPTSELSRLNRDAFKQAVRVSVEMWDLLLDCEGGREGTSGCFDIAAGSPMGDRQLLFDANRSIRFAQSDTQLDFGGVGKGYALDRAAAIVRAFGVSEGLLNAGTSSVMAIGRPSNGDAMPSEECGWPVDIRDPDNDTHPPVGRVFLSDCGFSCSAARHPSQFISDVRDPASGEPISGCAACAVAAPTALEAEILLTGLLVMGRQRTIEHPIAKRWPGAQVGWIEQGRLHRLAQTT